MHFRLITQVYILHNKIKGIPKLYYISHSSAIIIIILFRLVLHALFQTVQWIQLVFTEFKLIFLEFYISTQGNNRVADTSSIHH